MDFFRGKTFSMNFDLKMGFRINLRIIMKNQAADPKKEFLTISIFKPYGCIVAMPTAWELNLKR